GKVLVGLLEVNVVFTPTNKKHLTFLYMLPNQHNVDLEAINGEACPIYGRDEARHPTLRTPFRTPGSRSRRPAQALRICAWVTLLPGATLWVNQTLPPMVEPAPTVMRPRTVAPA